MPKKTLQQVIATSNTIILQVKENQKSLLEELIYVDSNTEAGEIYAEIGKEHGRVEERITKMFPVHLDGWNGIITGCSVLRKISHKKKNQFIDTKSISYYITNAVMKVNELQQTIRGHWGIENSNHHIRDVVLMEDSNRIRVKPENMMIIRSFGYNIIQTNNQYDAFTSQVEANKLQFEKALQFKGVKDAYKV